MNSGNSYPSSRGTSIARFQIDFLSTRLRSKQFAGGLGWRYRYLNSLSLSHREAIIYIRKLIIRFAHRSPRKLILPGVEVGPIWRDQAKLKPSLFAHRRLPILWEVQLRYCRVLSISDQWRFN